MAKSQRSASGRQSWAQRAPQYDGPLLDLYQAGVDLLREAQRAHNERQARGKRQHRLAVGLSLTSAVLAAVAGVTVLPEGVDQWIPAVSAFGASVTSAVVVALAPERQASEAGLAVVAWIEIRDATDAFLERVAASTDPVNDRPTLTSERESLQQRRNAQMARQAQSDVALGGE